ncbi:hypothetical protein [Roseateles oligotrophus]|uniref:DUF2782 domain-containing protein n=1 Tax=Roseateles oligotrophus TaxID=1769250 RepID=A0ABT2Y9Y8_9BURK|nr:hypothetical protein [Roseateles oligotrophus]MCV2367103.1 hypothetical protein [Roseateles oligotrophus]
MSRTLITHRPTALLALLLAAFATPTAFAAEVAESAGSTQTVADAKVVDSVIEDDSTRIEELRVRGQTQKVTVQPKNSKLPSYEIIMGDGSRDLSPGAGTTRAAAGRRVWSVLNF